MGSEGVMRKWLYRNKFSLIDTDFFSIPKTNIDTKDIMKILKTNDTEDALIKIF